ncbi:MAG: RCKP-type rubredoxin-like domain-containing protein [Bacillota bacterium]
MAVWKCAECGNVVEARCKPGKCKSCGAPKDKLVKEGAPETAGKGCKAGRTGKR